MVKKILFLNPIILYKRWPFPSDFVRFALDVPSVTFAQLAACVPNHECEILDGTVEKIKLKDFVFKIKEKDIIAISVHSGLVSLNAELSLILIKRIKPDIKIVLGGHHPTIYYKEWLEKGADFVIRKEGELTFQELVEAIALDKDLSRIKGISYRIGGKIISNPDRPFIENLDDLPMPRWELINYKKYNSVLINGGFSGSIETSRGCVFKCHFCLVPILWDSKQRFKSVDRVIKELLALKQKGVDKLYFVDDNFGANYERDIILCKEIIKQKLDIQWMCFSRADYIMNHPDLYKIAAQAGLKIVLIGFETMRTSNCSLLKKNYCADLVIEDYIELYKFLKENGIFTMGLFVIGYPGEELNDIKFTLSEFHLVCDYPLMTPFRPAANTKAYDIIKNDLLGDMFYHDSQAKIIKSVNFIITHRNFIVNYCFNPLTFLKMFSRDKLKSSFFRAHYKHLFYNFFNLEVSSLKDIFYILFSSKFGKEFYKRKVVKRYLKKYENFNIDV
jgi:radical SAM superfamily enzyme YgiQ (UPF0313 family)